MMRSNEGRTTRFDVLSRNIIAKCNNSFAIIESDHKLFHDHQALDWIAMGALTHLRYIVEGTTHPSYYRGQKRICLMFIEAS